MNENVSLSEQKGVDIAERYRFAVATEVSADILIMDEVLSVGDVTFRDKSKERIDRFRQSGMTILLVSHNLSTIESMCNRAIWVDNGTLKADGPVQEVIRLYRQGAAARDSQEA